MEEKIIDGVNVAGCVLLDEWKHCNICKELIKTIPDRHQCLTEQDLRCEYYSNCYYKQLKRLEQENERLKEALASFMNGDYCAESCKKMNNAFQDAHKAILKENGELKNILKDIDKKLESALDVEQTDAEESFDLLYAIQDLITEAIGE